MFTATPTLDAPSAAPLAARRLTERRATALTRTFVAGTLVLGAAAVGAAGYRAHREERDLRVAATRTTLGTVERLVARGCTLASNRSASYEGRPQSLPATRELRLSTPLLVLSEDGSWAGADLAALAGEPITDGWGRPVFYRRLASGAVRVSSFGPDGRDDEGGHDDVSIELPAGTLDCAIIPVGK